MYLDPQQVARALGGKARGKQVTAPGPGHSRLDRSLAVTVDAHAPDGFVVYSHAGDDPIRCRDHVRDRLGLGTWKPRAKGNGAAGSTNGRKTSDAKLIAAYTYMSETGEPYLRVLRYEPKTFKQQKWDGRSWRWGKPDGPKIPYNLPAVVKAETVFVCEGERDCDRLHALGLVATTASEGAGKWVPGLARWFEDKRVFIIADKDEPGRAHAQNVAWSLYSITESVRVVELPEGKDVSEWLDGGGDPATLVALCEGFPVWKYDPTKATAAAAPEAGKVPSEIAFIDVETIQPVPVTWVWPRRVARGKLALLAGDPGLGKSQIVLDIIARITTGAPWPDDGHAPRGRCIILTAEDAISDTIRPRLEAAGANLKLVKVLDAILDEKGQRRTFNLRRDLERLKGAVDQYGDVVLICFDPITSYLGDNIDSHRTSDVRAVLEPVAAFAEETGVALIGISHPTKAVQSKALNSVTGSLAFVAAARVVLMATGDPDDEDRKLLLPVKNNLSPEAEGIGYKIVTRPVTNDIIAPYVAWDSEPVTVSASEAMRASHDNSATKVDEAVVFLREQLSGGPATPEAIIAKAATVKIGERTLKKGKKKLGVVSRKSAFGAGWLWDLPAP